MDNMLTNFVTWVRDRAQQEARVVEVGDQTMLVEAGRFRFPPVETVTPLQVNTLEAILNYLRSRFLDPGHPNLSSVNEFLVHIETPQKVTVHTAILSGPSRDRETRMKATAFVANPFPEGQWLLQEDAMIRLQQSFVHTDALEKVLAFVGGLRAAAENSEMDDGVTQKTVVKTAAFAITEVVVPNPVRLVTHCTFPEIAQPEREYVLRIGKDVPSTIALFPTSDLAWKIETIAAIAAYLAPDGNDDWVVLS